MKRIWPALFAPPFLLSASLAPAAVVYDLSAQFGAGNPSGAWSYVYGGPGASQAPQAFPTYAAPTAADPLAIWWNGSPSSPNAIKNTSDEAYVIGAAYLPAGQTTAHPGLDGAVAAYVFTAPSASTYDLTATFSGLDSGGPTDTQVKVVEGGFFATPLFLGTVYGFAGSPTQAAFGASPSVRFSDALTLSAGESVYFEVALDPADPRALGPLCCNTTGVSATVTAAPEISTWAMLLLGFAGLALAGLRRRPRSPV